jgi:hypothetical protein
MASTASWARPGFHGGVEIRQVLGQHAGRDTRGTPGLHQLRIEGCGEGLIFIAEEKARPAPFKPLAPQKLLDGHRLE